MGVAIKDILTQAKNLIENPNNWTTGNFARNGVGQAVAVGDKTACKFCAIGAVRQAVFNNVRPAFGGRAALIASDATNILDKTSKSYGCESAINLNDWCRHETVIEMFDKAIASC